MRNIFLVVLVIVTFHLNAQELNSTIRISTPKLQLVDPSIFKSLQNDLQDFINNQKWTDDDFEDHERIECTFQLNITEEIDERTFRADIAILATRPVFSSDYKTALITHVDQDIIFDYEQFQQIEDSRDNYRNILSSLFTFYAYVILGTDYDSFSPLGGDEHWQTAQNVISTIPPGVSSADQGWTSLGRKNGRYWIVENMLNPRAKSFRESLYKYHRMGLDVMSSDTESATSQMLQTLQEAGDFNSVSPNSISIQMFTNAKGDEIVEVFKQGNSTQKREVYQVMRKLDPANAGKYNIIRN